MQKFDGFPDGSKLSPTAFPVLFFSQLLPMIDDLAELKVTIFCFWALHQKGGRFRYLRRREFSQSPELRAGLCAACPGDEAEVVIDRALARAVERGTLLTTHVTLERGTESLYFVNTELGRVAVEQIRAGQWIVSDDLPHQVEILPERPNIYRLYEKYIGMITPRVADHLKAAEQDYPPGWVEEAIYVAVDSQKRNWRYIQGILKRWEKEGKGGDAIGRPAPRDGESYVTGKYADFIKS